MTRTSRSLSLSIIALAVAASAIQVASAAELNIHVTGIDKTDGNILVALYDQSTFLKKPLKGLRISAAEKSVSATFADLPDGEYAVSAVHDENANGRMDSNLMGIPTEKWGFSNDAVGTMGPPQFADARFVIKGENKSLVITLR